MFFIEIFDHGSTYLFDIKETVIYCRYVRRDMRTTTNMHIPYPPVRTEGKNPAYAQLMLSDMGGLTSEMTAVSLYVYNMFITSADVELSAIYHDIAMIEMRHLEIFGKLAFELGADPRLWERQNRAMVYWSPSCTYYPAEPKAMLKNSLRSELSAIEKYERQKCEIKDRFIVDILERILLDERLHADMFKALLAKRP